MLRRVSEFLVVLSSVAATSCADAAYARLTAHATSTSGETDDVEPDATSTGHEPIATVTTVVSGVSTSGGTTFEETAGLEAPTIDAFTVDPPVLTDAGPAWLEVDHSPDVIAIKLFELVGDEPVLLAEITPAELPWEFAVTSDSFNGIHEFRAEVVSNNGDTAEAEASLHVSLPAGGTEVWTYEGEDDVGPMNLGTAVAAVDDGAIIIGQHVAPGDSSMIVRKVDADAGTTVWELAPDYNVTGNAVVVGDDGTIVIAGCIVEETISRMWVHKLDRDGQPLADWPRTGPLSTCANDVAINQAGDAFIVGDKFVEALEDHHDVVVWKIPAVGPEAVVTWDNDHDFFVEDHAQSVVVRGADEVFIAGFSVLNGQNFADVERPFLLELSKTNALKLLWIAPIEADECEAALGLAVDELGGLVLSGWWKPAPMDYRRAVVTRLEGLPDYTWDRTWTFSPGWETPGYASEVSRDAEGRLVVAATIVGGIDDDIRLFALPLDGGEPVWESGYAYPLGGDDIAYDLKTDPYGYSYYIGTTITDDGFHIVAGRHRP